MEGSVTSAPGNCHSLRLATGKLIRPVMCALSQSYPSPGQPRPASRYG